MQTTYTCGNTEITTSVTGSEVWKKENIERVYYQLDHNGAKITKTIQSLYRIVSGPCRDRIIEVNGVKFGYDLGGDFMSKTKRAAGETAVTELAQQILAAEAN